jgi:Na+-transporting NADH:ubiquinone oxidoreductase subunit C
MIEKPWYAVAYMFCVTAFFSFFIIGLAHVTGERVKANEQLALEKAVLTALGLAEGKAAAQIHQTFTDQIRPLPGGAGYELVQNGAIAGYAVEVAGKGFWAPIAGIIGLKPDRRTVAGIAFYEQNETPGLGAEIANPPFRRQFEGLKLGLSDKPIGIKPFGSETADNEVHAISGATQTCTRLEKLINDDLKQWLEGAAGEENK